MTLGDIDIYFWLVLSLTLWSFFFWAFLSKLWLSDPIPNVLDPIILIVQLVLAVTPRAQIYHANTRSQKAIFPNPIQAATRISRNLWSLIPPKSIDTLGDTFKYIDNAQKLCIAGCFPRVEILRIRTISSPLSEPITSLLRQFLRIRIKTNNHWSYLDRVVGRGALIS